MTNAEAMVANPPAPCPSCGGPAKIVSHSGTHGLACKSRYWRGYVTCRSKRCGMQTAVYTNPEKALRMWNDRRPIGERA